jgi:hypothetical protein
MAQGPRLPDTAKFVSCAYRNHPGRVLVVFSSPALAMKAPRDKEVIGTGTWEERTSGIWICRPSDDGDFYFSVESWQVVN